MNNNEEVSSIGTTSTTITTTTNNNNGKKSGCCGGGNNRASNLNTDDSAVITDNNDAQNKKNKENIFTNYDYLFKVILIGDSSVGKSCFLQKMVDGKFVGDFLSTIGVDFKIKVMDTEDKKVKIQIWDTAGQERYRNLTRSYYRNCNGIVVMYDITKQHTFDSLKGWISEITNSGNSGIPILLLGNKSDLSNRRVISTEQGSEFAKTHDLQFHEISVKTSENLEQECMDNFVRRMIEFYAKEYQDNEICAH